MIASHREGRPRPHDADHTVPLTDDLHRPSFTGLLATMAAVCLVVWLVLGGNQASTQLTTLALSLSLALLAAFIIGRRWPRLGGAVLSLGLGVTICLVALAMGSDLVFSFLAVPVVAAGIIVSPVAALPAAAAAIAALLLCGVTGQTFEMLAVLNALIAVTIWTSLRPQRQLLLNTWQRGLDALRLADQLRAKQGELNRTIKALDLSYQLLEKTNRELAVAQREAEQLRDLRHRFATNLSHELRTPLNIVLGFANLIYRSPELYGIEEWNDALMRDVAQIQRNARYLSQLVDDVVDLARIDALAMPIRREMTSIRQAIDESVEAISSVASGKGIELVVSTPPGLPDLPLDPVRIRQVLFNLLSNAVRFTDQGRVEVGVTLREAEVEIAVHDTGRGIPPADLSTIFNEFYQVGRPKTAPDSGKGLGLAIAKRFIQLHGGRIWADSVVGEGSTFHFTVPTSDAEGARSRAARPVPLPKRRQPPQVLTVSRDDSAALYLGRRMEGYTFTHCANLESVRQALVSQHPVAVLVDASLGWSPAVVRGELSGGGTCPPVIECPLPNTGWLSGGAEFTAVLTKPIMADRLLAAVAQAAGGNGDGRPRHVLVVDDDRGFVQLVSRTLESGGGAYQTECAYSGEEALRKMRRSAPDCLLLDLMLPGMNGFDVLAEVRADAALHELPVVALTASTPGEDQLASEGVVFALSKAGHFRPGELSTLLTTALDLASGEMLLRDSDAAR
ncbi:MAG: ATP-binding response regulator [Anaerolineae bacterium]